MADFLDTTLENIGSRKVIEATALNAVSGTVDSSPLNTGNLTNLQMAVTGMTTGAIRAYGNVDGSSLSDFAIGSTVSANGLTNLSSLLPLKQVTVKAFNVGTPTVKLIGNNL